MFTGPTAEDAAQSHLRPSTEGFHVVHDYVVVEYRSRIAGVDG